MLNCRLGGASLAVFLTMAASQAAEPKIAEQAPDVTIAEYLKAPRDAKKSLTALRGSVVVLDFWTPT